MAFVRDEYMANSDVKPQSTEPFVFFDAPQYAASGPASSKCPAYRRPLLSPIASVASKETVRKTIIEKHFI